MHPVVKDVCVGACQKMRPCAFDNGLASLDGGGSNCGERSTDTRVEMSSLKRISWHRGGGRRPRSLVRGRLVGPAIMICPVATAIVGFYWLLQGGGLLLLSSKIDALVMRGFGIAWVPSPRIVVASAARLSDWLDPTLQLPAHALR